MASGKQECCKFIADVESIIGVVRIIYHQNDTKKFTRADQCRQKMKITAWILWIYTREPKSGWNSLSTASPGRLLSLSSKALMH
jgi:hypothetical protein